MRFLLVVILGIGALASAVAQTNRPQITISKGDPVAIEFTAEAGREYSVLYRNSLIWGDWLWLADIESNSMPHTVQAMDNVEGNSRYYAVRSPMSPIDDSVPRRHFYDAARFIRAYEFARYSTLDVALVGDQQTLRAAALQATRDFISTGREFRLSDGFIWSSVLALAYTVSDDLRSDLVAELSRDGDGSGQVEAEIVRLVAQEFGAAAPDISLALLPQLPPEVEGLLPPRRIPHLLLDLDLYLVMHGWFRGCWNASGVLDQDRLFQRLLSVARMARLPVPRSHLAEPMLETVEEYSQFLSDPSDQTIVNEFILETLWERAQTEALWDLDMRVEALEAWRGDVEAWMAQTDTAILALSDRVTEVEESLTNAWKAIYELQQQVASLEEWVFPRSAEPQERTNLLRRYAPIFRFDDDYSGPVMSPSEFVNECELLNGPSGEVWTAELMVSELDANDPSARLLDSDQMEIIPVHWRDRHLFDDIDPFMPVELQAGPQLRKSMNIDAIANKKGVFGYVDVLGDIAVSLKYFMFLGSSWSVPISPDGFHEGDWICVDLHLVFKPQTNSSRFDSLDTTAIIVHHHGDSDVVPADEIEWREGRPVFYLERGANEPFHKPGEIGIDVEPHYGNGPEYDTLDAVVDLAIRDPDVASAVGASDSQILEATLVMLWRGEWGEYDDDDFKWLPVLGKDVTNPKGPRYQPKMWNRSSLRDPLNPLVR